MARLARKPLNGRGSRPGNITSATRRARSIATRRRRRSMSGEQRKAGMEDRRGIWESGSLDTPAVMPSERSRRLPPPLATLPRRVYLDQKMEPVPPKRNPHSLSIWIFSLGTLFFYAGYIMLVINHYSDFNLLIAPIIILSLGVALYVTGAILYKKISKNPQYLGYIVSSCGENSQVGSPQVGFVY